MTAQKEPEFQKGKKMSNNIVLENLIEKCKYMKENNQLIKVGERFCKSADVEGLRKIIRDDPRISYIECIPKNPQWLDFIGCDEIFYTTNDVVFNQIAREQILKI